VGKGRKEGGQLFIQVVCGRERRKEKNMGGEGGVGRRRKVFLMFHKRGGGRRKKEEGGRTQNFGLASTEGKWLQGLRPCRWRGEREKMRSLTIPRTERGEGGISLWSRRKGGRERARKGKNYDY